MSEYHASNLSPDTIAHRDGVGIVRASGEYRLVAIKPIEAAARLFRLEGRVTHRPSRHSLQIGEGRHLEIDGDLSAEEALDRYPWWCMNHSCQPSTVVCGREVIALRAIAPWEELTFDYNTTEYDLAEPFLCKCGSHNCIGQVRGFRHLSEAQRQRLLPAAAPHVLASSGLLPDRRRLELSSTRADLRVPSHQKAAR